MSLENFHLPAIVIHNLYKDSLIDLSITNGDLATATAQPGLNFLGTNAQNIVLLVDNKEEIYLTDSQLSFLIGILNACKLTLADIALINIAKQEQLMYQDLGNTLKPRIVIMFGVLPAAIKLPFNIPLFQVQTFNHQLYLSVPPLYTLEDDKELKRKLWTSLKQIFSL